ncbi:MAG: insulinase family protein [Solobacterium sp.]|nr:insulinase family protein [Solobacterium sp.]
MKLDVNDRAHGFIVNRVSPVEDLHGVLYELTHEKTGAELVWLSRADENKTFCIGFKTIPEDDSGVFHICEHSVLNGSRKYPVREPFVDLLKSSLQTFLNAMTYPDKTIYPVSSRNPKDFLNLMDVYLDAVLHPAIYTNPNIFYQEGWHYEIRKEEDTPVYKGVVLNEMKGAFSSVDEVLLNEVNRVLFPDNCYRFVSGGDPEKITDLSYEQFLEAHSRYYHPSNSRTFLDGDLDIDAALEKINSFFESYEQEDRSFTVGFQGDHDVISTEVPYEIGEEEDPSEKTEIAFAKLLCSYEDTRTQLAWRVLSTVLTGSNEAPLKKAILEQGLGQDVELDVMDELLQPYLLLVIRNTDPDKLDGIRNAVTAVISSLLESGLRKEELKAILNQMEFRYREQSEPAGVMLATTAYRSWMYGGDPAMYLSLGPLYEELRQAADTGYFEELLKEGLSDVNQLFTVTCVPDTTLSKKRRERESLKLKDAKEAWGESLKTYIERNRVLDDWQAAEDTPEQKATLPQLQLSDVSPLPEPFEPTVTEIDGIPALVYPESENGVIYLNLYFNLAGVTRDHLSEVGLLADLLLRLRTETHTLPELQELIRGNIGTLSFRTDAFTVDRERETCYPVLAVSCSVLRQNLETAVDLIKEVITETRFEAETILPLLQQYREQYRQMFIGGGHAAAVMRVGAHSSAESVAKEYFGGCEAAAYTAELCDNYESRSEEIIANCRMYAEELFTAARMTVSISGEDNLPVIRRLTEGLALSGAQRAKVHYPLLDNQGEGIQVPAQISYTAAGNNLQSYGAEYSGAVRTVAQILTYGYLWNEIRVKGGAYGTGFAVSPSGNVSCWSYRDPSARQSLETFKGAADYIESLADEESDLTSYIIGTISSAEPLLSPGAKIRSADARWFSGITYEARAELRKQILETDNDALRQIAGALRNALNDAITCVVGSAETLDACEVQEKKTLK